MEDQKYFPPSFCWTAIANKYPSGDSRENNENNIDYRNAISRIEVDIRDMHLSPLQRERLIFLLGPRYDPRKVHKLKLVARDYQTFQENYLENMDKLRQLYWEALRAPSDNTTIKRNPYRREYLTKKLFGKTKEERVQKKKELKQSLEEHKKAIEQSIVEKELELKQVEESKSKKRKEYAQ